MPPLRTLLRPRDVALVALVLGGCASAPEEVGEVGNAPAKGTLSVAADAGTSSAVTFDEICLDGAPLAPALGCDGSDALDDALAALSLDRCRFGVDPAAALVPASPLRSPSLAAALAGPLRQTVAARTLAQTLGARVRLAAPASRVITTLRGQAPTCWPRSPQRDLVGALGTGLLADADRAAALEAAASLPPDMARDLGGIVLALAGAFDEVARLLPPADRNAFEHYTNWVLYSAPTAPSAEELASVAAFDDSALTLAAAKLSYAVESANLMRYAGRDVPDVTIPTRLGDIVVRGPRGHETRAVTRPVAFWLDTGGDDVLLVPAGAASPTQRVSVLVDLAGNDRYGYVEGDKGTKTRLPADASGRLAEGRTKSRTARQGGAFMGIGLMFDLGAGKDVYRSLALSQGAAAFGVGLAFDDGGDDDFAAETLSQGAAVAGLGILMDASGNDQRRVFTRSQGYGAARGTGLLLDVSGNDATRANPGDPKLGGELLYPADPDSYVRASAKPNHSAVQGFGEGRRGLSGDGVGAGGLGLLADLAGDDRYEAGAFAQGGGLEEGLGMLFDGGGNDRYDALAYAQGAGIHRAFGVLVDEGGDDRFNAVYTPIRTALGVGHDYGAGVFLDLGGKDAVRAPTLALGAGSMGGAGLYLARGGDDAFQAASAAAFATTVATDKVTASTLAVFVKASGKSSYRVANHDEDLAGSLWKKDKEPTRERAVGLDAPSGNLDL